MGKKIKITIVVAVIAMSIPLCMKWLSAVGYYFSDKGEQASSPLEFSLKGTTVEVVGFQKGQNKETVIIPEKAICCGYLCTVTSIGRGAFSGCSGMTSVKIPSSVTKIGWEAFSGCSGLTSVEIPTSVTEIGGGAFSGCSGLTSVEIPSSVTKIGWLAFKGCKKLDIVIDNRADVEIGKYAFEGCKSVTWKEDM